MFHHFLIAVLGAIFLMAADSYAQGAEERGELVSSYIDFRKNGSSIYQPPPITHMVPSFNTITYAMAYEKRNVTVLSREANGDLDTFNQGSLKQSGYTLAPHLAISLKKVGIGFSIENSKNMAEYSFRPNYGNSYETHQMTTVAASGLGFNLSALPFEKFRKENKLALIIGGKSLSVHHEYTDFLSSNNSGYSVAPTTLQYNILRYEIGANLTLALLKHFSVIPWLDYSMADTKSAMAAFNSKGNAGNAAAQRLFEDDILLFWKPYPNLRYGIDLSIGVFGLDIRIGSFLGSLARLNASPDYMQDKSFTLSLSFDQKGG